MASFLAFAHFVAVGLGIFSAPTSASFTHRSIPIRFRGPCIRKQPAKLPYNKRQAKSLNCWATTLIGPYKG